MGFDMEKMLQAFNEIQEESDNREKSVINKNTSEQRSHPWDNLNEEDWTLFMEEVDSLDLSERYKDKGSVMDYYEVCCKVWERWDKNKINKI